MTEIIRTNFEEFNVKGADILESALKEMLAQLPHVVFAIPGGRSVSGIFNEVTKREIDWTKVHIFIVDERIVPLTHEDSNYRQAKEHLMDNLIDQGKMPRENVHPFRMEQGIGEYADELQDLGGRFNIVLLSSGEDGHIGAIYPNHHSNSDESDYFMIMQDSPKPPPERMSMSRKLLLRAEVVLLLFMGDSKRDALNLFLDDNTTPENCPAVLVKKIQQSYALTDLQNGS